MELESAGVSPGDLAHLKEEEASSLGTACPGQGGTSLPLSWQGPQEPQGSFERPGHPRAWLGALGTACLLKVVGQGKWGLDN